MRAPKNYLHCVGRTYRTTEPANPPPNSRVQVTPLARPVNRGDHEGAFRAVRRTDLHACQRRT